MLLGEYYNKKKIKQDLDNDLDQPKIEMLKIFNFVYMYSNL